jgi:hypothetical protein
MICQMAIPAKDFLEKRQLGDSTAHITAMLQQI